MAIDGRSPTRQNNGAVTDRQSLHLDISKSYKKAQNLTKITEIYITLTEKKAKSTVEFPYNLIPSTVQVKEEVIAEILLCTFRFFTHSNLCTPKATSS